MLSKLTLSKYYGGFFFWLYNAIGFLSLSYISYHTIFIGSITIHYDWIKPIELLVFSLIALTFISKSIVYLKKMINYSTRNT